MKWDPKKVKVYNLGRKLTKEEKVDIETAIKLLKEADEKITVANNYASTIGVVAYSKENAIKFYNEANILLQKVIREEESIANASKIFENYIKKVGTNVPAKFAKAEYDLLSRVRNIEKITKEIINTMNFIIARLKSYEKIGVGMKGMNTPISKQRELGAQHKIEMFNLARRVRIEMSTLIHNLETLDMMNNHIARTLDESEYLEMKKKQGW